MLVEIGLFQGDQLLEKGAIRVTAQEANNESEAVSLCHRLVEDMAKIELSVFDARCAEDKIEH